MTNEKQVGEAQKSAKADTAEQSFKYEITEDTIGKRQACLPIGTLGSDGAHNKALEVRPWRYKEEKELGALRDRNKNASMAKYVSLVLSTMCSKIGSHDMESMKEAERMAIISQLYLADVFYAYVWLRINAMGNILKSKINCPRCAHSFDYPADLNTVDVRCADGADKARWHYSLKNPIEIRGKKVDGFTMGPMRWNAMEMAGSHGGLNMGIAKGSIIIGSIVEVDNHGQLALSESDLEEMTKIDIEGMSQTIDDKTLGPDMSINDNCPRCGSEYHLPIDWSYDNFFSSSSG